MGKQKRRETSKSGNKQKGKRKNGTVEAWKSGILVRLHL